MSEQKQTKLPQSVIWAAIAAVALVGIGLMVIAWILLRDDGNGTPTPPPTTEANIPIPSPTPIVTFLGIRQIAELATVETLAVVEVQNEKIPDDIRNWVGVKEEILMLVYGNVKAGFDLSKLSENDLKADGTQVQLTLPAPE
ncbi:MAG: DUF4230 domain-containing protein, partial [Chloroflexi bacterium]|nr:DUF4230 domain-containing protein [Chloroflexota bacterium]